MANQELAVIDVTPETDLVIRRPPVQVLEEARAAATSLLAVVSAKPRKVVLNGEQYLEFEDWQTVARFYRVTPKIVSTQFVAYGGVAGFTATAVAVRADGVEISRAEADCLNDEEKWRAKPKYDRQIRMKDGTWVSEPVDEGAYPKNAWVWLEGPRRPESRRIRTGDDSVPLFQLKSMAQTRACSKVLRQCFAWVVVLAGYRPTPAEELEAHVIEGHAEPVERPVERPQEQPKASGAPPATKPPTEAQGAPEQASTAKAAQPTVPASPGTTTVLSVEVKKGASKKGPWTRYYARFADGREGSTFSDSVGEELQLAAKAEPKIPVNPELTKAEKGWNILQLLPIVPPEPTYPPDEPVDGPEKVLTVRQIETDHGTWWEIQTDKRRLASDKKAYAEQARDARTAKLGIVPTFEVRKARSGSLVNFLTGLVVETPREELPESESAEDFPEPGSDG